MRIILLHNTSDLYGASRILLYTVEVLENNGHKCIVVLSEKGQLTEELQKLNIEVKIIRLGILRRKYFNFTGIINRIGVTWSAWRQLSKLIKTTNPDLIYSNTTGVLIGAFVAKANNVKHLWHLHEIILKPKIFTKFVGLLVNKLSDKVIVVSDAVFNHWKNYIEVEKISRIYNGIKTDGYNELVSGLRNELHLTLDDVIVLMVGRINHWKGQSYFLDIAHELAKKFLNVKFVMVGDPYQGNEHLLSDLNEKITKLNLDNHVINLGYRTDIRNILKGSDIFISPSILPDPFPTVVLEAMAAGLPVIATAHGGPKEMVEDQITGFLIPINDAKKAASYFIELIESKKLRIEMGNAGSNRLAQLFSLKSFERNLLEAIK